MSGTLHGVMDTYNNKTPKIIVCQFDEQSDDTTYAKFHNIIEELGYLKGYLGENSWLILTDKSCKEVVSFVKENLEHVKRIFVGELTGRYSVDNCFTVSGGIKEK